ncbi:MAG: hypothetical protein EVA65_16045 [Oceanococcus sp.]|nr:MAG: hypothetical protein EVA65_16045 [Oceanococcus sp.]
MTSTYDPVARFADEMIARGIGLPSKGISPDGELHRFQGEGDKRGCLNAWYVLYLHPIPCGAFGNWRLGATFRWKDRDCSITPHIEHQFRQIQRERNFSRKAAQEAAALKAAKLVESSDAATLDHPYLIAKRIKRTHNARNSMGNLLIPLQDVDGKIWNTQTIDESGQKRFAKSARIQSCFALFGSLSNGSPLLICEGWATAATLFEREGLPTLAAMNAGNLLPVALAVRSKWPDRVLMICGDDDRFTEGNPGRTKANEAALAANASVAFPSFGPGDFGTDFNDQYLTNQGGSA